MKRGELRISIFVVGMQKWFYELFFCRHIVDGINACKTR